MYVMKIPLIFSLARLFPVPVTLIHIPTDATHIDHSMILYHHYISIFTSLCCSSNSSLLAFSLFNSSSSSPILARELNNNISICYSKDGSINRFMLLALLIIKYDST